MPLLKREADLHPLELFELSVEEYPWWIVYVRSRQEKALARHLERSGVPFYLPQVEKRMRRQGRTYFSYHPLFSGYLFLRPRQEQRLTVWQTRLLVNTIDVVDQQLLGGELAQLHALEQQGATLVPHPWIGPGDEVKITDGAFQGYRGLVIREKGQTRLVVSVTMLQKSIAVEFERDILAPTRPDPRAHAIGGR